MSHNKELELTFSSFTLQKTLIELEKSSSLGIFCLSCIWKQILDIMKWEMEWHSIFKYFLWDFVQHYGANILLRGFQNEFFYYSGNFFNTFQEVVHLKWHKFNWSCKICHFQNKILQGHGWTLNVHNALFNINLITYFSDFNEEIQPECTVHVWIKR